MLALRRAARLWKAVRPVLESFRPLRSRRRRMPDPSIHSAMEPLEQRQLLSGIIIESTPCITVDEGQNFDLCVTFSDSEGTGYYACVNWGDGSSVCLLPHEIGRAHV